MTDQPAAAAAVDQSPVVVEPAVQLLPRSVPAHPLPVLPHILVPLPVESPDCGRLRKINGDIIM